jgi:hypothetical protein
MIFIWIRIHKNLFRIRTRILRAYNLTHVIQILIAKEQLG